MEGVAFGRLNVAVVGFQDHWVSDHDCRSSGRVDTRMGSGLSTTFLDSVAPTAVGIDVVSIRLERALRRNLFSTVCHPELETEYSMRSVRLVWSAKEATVKTLGTGFGRQG